MSEHFERTYVLRDAGVRERCVRTLSSLDLAGCYEVIIRPWKDKRSEEQNNLFHVIISQVASATGNSPRDVKAFLKNEFGPRIAVQIHGVPRSIPKESSSYNVKEMSEMIDRAREWAATEFGIVV